MPRTASRSTTRSKSAKSRSRTRGAAKSVSRAAKSASRQAGSASRRGSAAPTARRRNGTAGTDAISLLKTDHRQVEELFETFQKARGDDRKQNLATRICNALRIHAKIEEEILYPAFREATRDEDLHNKSVIEHDNVKKLIAEIESSGPGDEYFDARVTVLSEMVMHHVREEEGRDGLFSRARSSRLDLAALGEQLAARKAQLESEPAMLTTAKQIKDAGKGLMTRVLTEV